MAGTNRVGRVSSIDYESGTYEVTYADQGRRVTARINAMSNGEYKMPRVGQIVSVTHTSNGTLRLPKIEPCRFFGGGVLFYPESLGFTRG